MRRARAEISSHERSATVRPDLILERRRPLGEPEDVPRISGHLLDVDRAVVLLEVLVEAVYQEVLSNYAE